MPGIASCHSLCLPLTDPIASGAHGMLSEASRRRIQYANECHEYLCKVWGRDQRVLGEGCKGAQGLKAQGVGRRPQVAFDQVVQLVQAVRDCSKWQGALLRTGMYEAGYQLLRVAGLPRCTQI